MSSKTHQTALAVVPPPEVWGPIQAIRKRYDRAFRRWMPHINLLYPFYPSERLDNVGSALLQACAKISPFELTLAEFRYFVHPSGRTTLWLAPAPQENLVQLQAALQAVCPECDDLSRFPAGFTPHLSVGQAGSTTEALELMQAWQETWTPIRFELSAVAILKRGPETPFAIERSVPLATE